MTTRMRWGKMGLLAVCVLLLVTALGVRAQDIGRTIENRMGLYPDFAANLRVQYIGHRLAMAAKLPNASFKIFNDPSLNALALPDGRIYLTSKMATVVSDDELAFVLGHEITHITEKHAQRQQERVTGGAILGAILVGVLGGSEEAIRMGADIAGGLTYGHYSQKDEYKADKGGILLMTQCGYDPKKAADAMQRLLDLYGRGDARTPILGWFASHPDTKNRKQRLLEHAAELEQHPLPLIEAPTGIEITLDPSAEHASAWAHAYLSFLLAANGAGRAVVLPAAQYPIPALLNPPPMPKKEGEKEKKDEPLPQVTVTIPPVPAGYRVTLALRQIPAGRAATLDAGEGAAVEATLRWTQVATGFSGQCVAIDQTRKQAAWQAQEQLQQHPGRLYELADGRMENLEGTLEATAVRRAAMAFAEILEANAPIDHSVPVTLNVRTEKLRPGDYVYVIRGNLIVAEVCVTRITGKKTAVGDVLWGTHTWKKKDRFEPVSK